MTIAITKTQVHLDLIPMGLFGEYFKIFPVIILNVGANRGIYQSVRWDNFSRDSKMEDSDY